MDQFLLITIMLSLVLVSLLVILKDETDNTKKVEQELAKTSARYVITLRVLYRIMESLKWNCCDAQELKHIIFWHIIKAMDDIERIG